MPVLRPVPEATTTNKLKYSFDNLISINVSGNYSENKILLPPHSGSGGKPRKFL